MKSINILSFPEFLTVYSARIEAQLNACLTDSQTEPQHLHQAMRHGVLNGGKRIRPLLVYAVGQIFNASDRALDAAACAVELIHCYSLIHDDLPAMDDDELRRGKLTCHKAFDEATAILAGDALQALAFEVIAHESNAYLRLQQQVRMMRVLSQACGSYGMSGGQALDLLATGKTMTLDYVEKIHRKKTGALFSASVVMGGIAGYASHEESATLKYFGETLGLAFQIQDDILDIEASTEQLGKMQGVDSEHNKVTYPALAGLQAAHKKVSELHEALQQHIHNLPKANALLSDLSHYLLQRQR